MSDIENKKADVIAMYPTSPRWRQRVLAMSDGQVFAIWKKNQDKKVEEKKPDPPQPNIPF